MLSIKKPPVKTPVGSGSGAASEAWSLDGHWPTLVAGLADQLTEGVCALQNSLDQLLDKGRITKSEHRVLSIPVERIRLAGVSAQQINRFYSGRIRQSHEKVDLSTLVEAVLQERREELGLLGIALRRKLKPVDVLIDPTVAHALVNAVLDWGLPFGSRVDVRVDLNDWPRHARLQVRVSNDGVSPSSVSAPDNLSWMLIQQIALSGGGIEIERQIHDDSVICTALFSRTVQAVDGISAVEFSGDQSSMFKSLSGIYVLTISPNLQIRADVRDVLRPMGIVSDSVIDCAHARAAVEIRMPSLIVVDSDVNGEDFEAFRRDLLREVLEFPFVEIAADDRSFDVSGLSELSMAKVGRGNIRETLGTAVMFELAKTM